MTSYKLLLVAVALPIVVVGVFAFTLFSNYFHSSVNSLEEGVEVGYLAQDFQLTDLDGNIIKLSDLRGKVVLIEFSVTWCGTCKAELDVLKALYSEYSHDDVVFITIDIDSTVDTLQEYRSTNGIEWTLASGKEVGVLYGVYSLPTIVVVDKNGVIRFRQSGYVEYSTLMDILNKLI